MGSHFDAYEALYKQIDPAGVNRIGALDAASYLKRSALPDSVLRDIWELADPERKGYEFAKDLISGELDDGEKQGIISLPLVLYVFERITNVSANPGTWIAMGSSWR